MKPELRPASSPDQLLSSWKDIANYLRRDVRTVQRWETTRGLPVHRLPGGGRNAIYAVRSEIDTWWSSSPAKSEPAAVVPLTVKKQPRAALTLLLLLALGLAGFLGWLLVHRPQPAPPLRNVPLTSLPGAEFHASLSPDGPRLAFVWKPEESDDYDVYVMRLPYGRPERLTDSPAIDWYPEWSPDGKLLVYMRLFVGADHFELRLIDPDTRRDRLIHASSLAAVEPPAWVTAWTPDSRAVIIPSCVKGGPGFGLARIDVDSGAVLALTRPEAPDVGDRLPTYSPDGRRILFLRKPIAGDGNIFVQEFDSAGLPAGLPRQITHEPCCVDSPSFTRDGKEIIFLSRRGGVAQLMRVPVSGGDPRPEASIPSPGANPRIATNGWLISSNIEVVGAVNSASLVNGRIAGKPRRLIASSHRDRAPAYSPDGKFIAFSSDRGGSRQLWLCGRDGSSPRQLTSIEGAAPGLSNWSPNGRWIAFEAQSPGGFVIYLCDPNSGRAWKLPLAGKQNRRPVWSRDGKTLYYSSSQPEPYQIWRVEIDREGKPLKEAQITRGGGFGAVVSADGAYLYYSKGFTFTALWRVPAGGGREEEVLGAFPFNRYPVNLTAGARGLYFRGRGDSRGAPVWLLPYSGGRPSLVLTETLSPSPSGLAVAPDESELLLPVFFHASGDILAVKQFK